MQRQSSPISRNHCPSIARRICTALLLAIAAAALLSPKAARSSAAYKPTEYEVKAAYLFNFGKFVRWPSELAHDQTFNLCVLGRDPFGEALDQLVQQETIDGKRIVVSRISGAAQASTCRIIFISDIEERRLPSILQSLHQRPILTVSDISGFASQGGMIEFVNDRERIRFAVNLDAADSAGIKLSSELLRIATRVTGGSQR
jgi:hypothetical protein